MNTKIIFSCLSISLISACSNPSEAEKKAADSFCECAANKSFLQKADCIDFSTKLNNVDKNSDGFRIAVERKCPTLYKKMQENAKKQEGKD